MMNKLTEEQIEIYKKQFKHEFELIKKCGYQTYFLIMEELVSWCRENNILTGPGRGSAAGSVISYLLGITTVDPIKHKLSFARFLNEGRLESDGKGGFRATSMVDIDVDFPDNKKEHVIKHLQELYGEYQIAHINTILKMESKSVVRDVSRAYEIPLFEVNKFCSFIIDDIDSALETEEGKQFAEKYPHIIKHSKLICGRPKSSGVHASGLLVAPHDLRETDATNLIRTKDGSLAVALDMDDCEFRGLLKLDALSLSTLSVISESLSLIKENHGETIDIDNIDIEDPEVYKSINSGNLAGIFQISTYVGQQLVKKMGVEYFDHLVAILSLSRPGPAESGITDEYIKRKHGEKWEKKHPAYEEITNDTNGLVIFQETIISILNKIAGFSLAESDKIRKLVGKKKTKEEFEPYRVKFVDGCKKVGYFSEKEADKFWEELLFFSRYGFSKNHAVPYSKITFITAWLKHYYPKEFLVGFLTAGPSSKKEEIIKEIVRLGIEIVTPKIGYSDGHDWKIIDGKIFAPFISVKGFGPKTAPKIAQYAAPVGFFESEDKKKKPKKIDIILDEINAYDLNKKPTKIEFSDFDGSLIIPWKEKQPRLNSIRQEFSLPDNYDDLFSCNDIKEDLITELKKPKQYLRGLGVCHECNLGKNCRAPVKPEFGKYNVMIIAEASHWVDDKKKIPLMSDEGTKALFPLLKKFGLTRDMFYVTTCVKCVTKKVMKEHIISCNDWLTKEIEYVKPKVVLAFGNTGLKYFKGVDSGIKRMNGVTEWNEEFDCWVCYCVRPVTALFDDTGKEELLAGIRNFVRKVRNLGLKEMRY